MDKLDIAGSILGLLARGVEAAADAIKASSAEKEDEAFAILFGVLSEAKDSVKMVRSKIEANKAAAKRELAEKFAAPSPTVLVDPDKAP